MDEPTPEPKLQRALSQDRMLAVDYDVPPIERHLEEQADRERERYDEQILAALIAPSF